MEKNGKPNIRKSIMIAVIVCALILVGFLGSYAFFIGQVGQNKNQGVSVQAGSMALTFSDGNNGFSKALEFGGSAEKTFKIENTGTGDGTVSMSWSNITNTYLEGTLTYTFSEADAEDGEYTAIISNKNVPRSEVASEKVLASGLTIPANTTKYYKLTITLNYTEEDQTADLTAKLDTQFKIVEGVLNDTVDAKTILAKLGKTAKEGNPTFATAATTDETADGLYTMEDDYGTSYYYRGNVADNYVKFAGYYWRIIRVNGDGSVRVIYDGTEAHANSDTSTDRLAWSNQQFNAKHDDAKYVGYMYGPANAVEGTTTASTDKAQAQTNTVSSDIKTKLEEWYVTNIKDKNLDGKVADSIFCYDRTTPGSEATGWSSDTGLGYGKNNTGYGTVSREGNYVGENGKAEPQYVCSNKNDAFTVGDTEKGNGSLSEKIGLISADEVVTGGSGKYNTTNQSYYLHKGKWYWVGSPYSYDGDYAHVFNVYGGGQLLGNNVGGMGGVAPVINLSAEYFNTLIGDGTIGNEFREA